MTTETVSAAMFPSSTTWRSLLWLAPLTMGGNLSLYRSEALLLPAVFLVPALPRWLQISLLAAAVVLSIPMAALFFRGVLV